MTVVITTNEPEQIQQLFPDRCEIPMGFDFLLYTNKFEFPIERKVIPGDLIASVQDGRLQRELIAMREVNPDYYMILLHGKFKFKGDDLVMPSKEMRVWSKKGVRNLMRSLQLMEGCIVETAETDEDLVCVINEWQTYLDSDEHRSIRMRPRFDRDPTVNQRVEKVRYFYSGLPGLNAGRSKLLEQKYKNPIDLYSASIEDIMKIDGFGKVLSTGIYNFLRGI